MIGKLRHKLYLQERVITDDNAGGFTHVWQNVTQHPALYAAVAVRGGYVFTAYHRPQFTVTHHIRIRYRSDITPEMRLIDDAKIYTIIALNDPFGDGRYLDIAATTGSVPPP